MDHMPSYQLAYQRLNDQQRRAVDTVEGPVFVMAGPGTGKTQILSTRIAHILATSDTQPHNVLALSFTQAAARNLQERLVAMIGPDAYRVQSTTFHSFCVDVIEAHPELFPLSPRSSEPIAQVDRYAVVEQILDENEFTFLKPAKQPHFWVSNVLQLITSYKREGHSPTSVMQMARRELESLDTQELSKSEYRRAESTAQKNLEAGQIFVEYERYLRERQTYDFEDMILWVRDVFRDHSDVLQEYQELYHYFLVDEWQDTNDAQLQLLQLLTAHWQQQANIFVVGDPNQSIYRFQGASLANTFRFLEMYPQAETIVLDTGYRCGQLIYDAAAELIQRNPVPDAVRQLEAFSTTLRVADDHTGSLHQHRAPNTLAESFWVADEMAKLHDAGVPYQEMAVLVRKHRHKDVLESVLSQRDIPFVTQAGSDILQHPLVLQVLRLMHFLIGVQTGQEKEYILSVLQQPWWRLPAVEVLQVLRAGSLSRDHDQNPWLWLLDDEALEQSGLDGQRWRQWRDQIIHWTSQVSQLALPQFVEMVLRESGFYQFGWQDDTPLNDVNAVSSFLREVHAWHRRHPTQGLSIFLERLGRMQEHNLSIPADDLQLQEDVVEVVTAHQAKGREWQYVFVLHVQDTYWGNVKSGSRLAPLPGTIAYADLTEDEHNEEERRLFYVALTRAKERVYATWSESHVDGDYSRELQKSQFLAEIETTPWQQREGYTADQIEDRIKQLFVQADGRSEYWQQLDRSWLRQLVSDFKMSVSALNEYLTCPVGFVYKRLIRVPIAPSPALTLGTAVHKGMELVYRRLESDSSVPELATIFPAVDRIVDVAPFLPDQQEQLRAKSKSLLTDYITAHADQLQPALAVEAVFGYATPVVFSGLQLVGKIDRIDSVDGLLNTVKVVDYKTGKPKSKNAIQGKTKTTDGSMFRQLVFYSLLAELDPTYLPEVTLGEFVFLEKNPTGKYKSESFALTPADREELKELLIEVSQELKSLTFLEKPPCGTCDMCQLLGLEPHPHG